MNLPALDNARRRCIDQLGGILPVREIEAALESIADAAVAEALPDPVDAVSRWVRDRRIRDADEAHERAVRKGPGAAVVAIGRPRGAA